MSLALLFHYLLLNMFRMLVHPSSGTCDLLYWCFSLHKDNTPPQPNHTVTPTHIEPEQCNPWNKSTISRKLLKMDVLTFETCWEVNSKIIKQVASSWSIFIQQGLVIPELPKEVDEKWTLRHSAYTAMPLRSEYLHHHVTKLASEQVYLSPTSQLLLCCRNANRRHQITHDMIKLALLTYSLHGAESFLSS